jgi:HK97 family phage major capsid protein
MTSMTEELLDDTMTIPDLYNLIVEFIGESQAEFLEDKILNGTLSTNATVEGLLVNSDVNEVTLSVGETVEDIDDDDLVDALMKIKRKFKRKGGVWVMSQYTMGKLQQLRLSADGAFIYPELRTASPRLWGYEVVVSDMMPVQDATEDIAGATSILFGNLEYFALVRRKGLSLERGYRTGDWQADIQSLKSNARYGGKCTFGEAFVKITNGAAS